MKEVVLYRFFRVFGVCLTEQLIVDSDAIIGECFAVAIVDALADLQKLEVKLHCLLAFFDVVVKHADRVIGTSLVPDLPRTTAPKSQHLIVLQPPHNSDVCRIVGALVETGRLLLRGLVEQRVLLDGSGGRIEEKRQFYAMRLRRCHRTIVAWPVETANLVFLSKGATYSKGFIGVALMRTVSAFGPTLHNKNINAKLYYHHRFSDLKNI
jgi:hypothetical protein